MGHMRVETLGGSIEADADGARAAFVADLMVSGSTEINLVNGTAKAPEVVEAAPDVSLACAQRLLDRLVEE